MKYLSLFLISAFFLINSNSQPIAGTWLADWQNSGYGFCSPSVIDIQEINSTTFNVTFKYALSMQIICHGFLNNTDDQSSILTLTGNTGVDHSGRKVVYNTEKKMLSYTFPSEDSIPYLYWMTGGPALSKQDSLGLIGGAWINPKPVNSSSCCHPNNLFLSQAIPGSATGQLNAVYNYGSNNCSGRSTINSMFQILNPSYETLNWTGVNTDLFIMNQIYFSPNSPNQITLVPNSSDSSCSYTYEKFQPQLLSPRTLYGDWQTLDNSESPYSYSITPIATANNGTYMLSTINQTDGYITDSYLLYTLEGQYFDSYIGLGTSFTYNQATDTLLNISAYDTTYESFLLSPTGSLLSSAPFVSFWGNAQPVGNTPLPSDCCVPSYINISNDESDASHLLVTYQLPEGYGTNPGCQDIIYINDGMIDSFLYIQTPSISQITWQDSNSIGEQLFLTNPTNPSEITVSNFFNQCSFKMTVTSAPKPTPKPLFGNRLISSVSTFLLSIFIFAIYI